MKLRWLFFGPEGQKASEIEVLEEILIFSVPESGTVSNLHFKEGLVPASLRAIIGTGLGGAEKLIAGNKLDGNSRQ